MSAVASDRVRGARKAQSAGASWERQVIDLAHQYGWRVASFRAVLVQRRNGDTRYLTPVQADGAGWPDLVLVRGSRMLVRELKTDGGVVTEDQRVWIESLAIAGVDVAVWRPASLPGIIQELRR